MKKKFALAVIQKNGFIVYKHNGAKGMTIGKRSEYSSDELFKKAVIVFKSEEEAEDFVQNNHLVTVEVVAFEM